MKTHKTKNGVTACKWDSIIPFDPLWQEYRRLIKPKGAIVLTAQNPFTAALIMSNPKEYRHSWVWQKDVGTGYLNAKKAPLKNTEDILVFAPVAPRYYPQFVEGRPYKVKQGRQSDNYGPNSVEIVETKNAGVRYPLTLIKFNRDKKRIHPTQKPVALFEYLIKTYTQPGEVVLDNCAGSGTTAVACINTGRQYIQIEREERFFSAIKDRLNGGEK